MASEATVTQEVADFIVQTRYEDLPEEVLRLSKQCITDGVAVMLAGTQEESFRVLREYLTQVGGAAEATVLGDGMRVPAHLAALANGLSGHAMDYDDTQLSPAPDRVYGLLTHPTTPVLGAALPLAESLGASGKDLILAFAVGFEAECKIAAAIKPSHYQRGFHTTGTIGALGAAAAAAKLYSLAPEQTRYALGIAASESSGIRANFGTMVKPYHAGRAAENGVVAARLASLGFQSDPDILDGQWGFFQVTGGGHDDEFIRGVLGKPWSVVEPGVSIKPYPCGSLAHPSMDAMLDLVLGHDVRPEQVEEVRLGTTSMVLNALRYQEPENALNAKFSIPFCLGILLLERKAGIGQFTDGVVTSPRVRSMMSRVHPYLNQEIEARGFDRIRSLVEVRLTDGRTLAKGADTSRGTPQRPFSRDDLREKFLDCSAHLMSAGEADGILATLFALEEVRNVGPFIRTQLGHGTRA